MRDPCRDVTTVLRRAEVYFSVLRFSEVNPLPWGTPVQGLGTPDGPDPDDGARLYSNPPQKKINKDLGRPRVGVLLLELAQGEFLTIEVDALFLAMSRPR